MKNLVVIDTTENNGKVTLTYQTRINNKVVRKDKVTFASSSYSDEMQLVAYKADAKLYYSEVAQQQLRPGESVEQLPHGQLY